MNVWHPSRRAAHSYPGQPHIVQATIKSSTKLHHIILYHQSTINNGQPWHRPHTQPSVPPASCMQHLEYPSFVHNVASIQLHISVMHNQHNNNNQSAEQPTPSCYLQYITVSAIERFVNPIYTVHRMAPCIPYWFFPQQLFWFLILTLPTRFSWHNNFQLLS